MIKEDGMCGRNGTNRNDEWAKLWWKSQIDGRMELRKM
jgi:hypothetical protein